MILFYCGGWFFVSKQREYDYPDPYGHEGQRPENGRIKKSCFWTHPQPSDKNK